MLSRALLSRIDLETSPLTEECWEAGVLPHRPSRCSLTHRMSLEERTGIQTRRSRRRMTRSICAYLADCIDVVDHLCPIQKCLPNAHTLEAIQPPVIRMRRVKARRYPNRGPTRHRRTVQKLLIPVLAQVDHAR